MASHVKLWRDRVNVADYDAQVKEVRSQLVEQLKLFDQQLEQKMQLLQDFGEYLRRRGEIEAEYARLLDKLAERFSSRIRRKEPSGQSVVRCWLEVLSQTREESRDHSALAEMCSTALPQDLSLCLDQTQRLAKRCKEACALVQDELLKATTELQNTLRTYRQYHSDCAAAEGKLREAEKQKQSAAKKVERTIEKRQQKVQEIQFKCTKARNDYLLTLAATNASFNKYYLEDISALIDHTDLSYHPWVSRVLRSFVSGQSRLQQGLSGRLEQLGGRVAQVDQTRDKEAFLQAHDSAYCPPLQFSLLPHEGDEVGEVSAKHELRGELMMRFQQLQSRLTAVIKETDEASKTLQGARTSLLELIGDQVGSSTLESPAGQSQETSFSKRRASLQDAEAVYCMKMKDQLCGGSLISKLQAKHDLLQVAIQKGKRRSFYIIPRSQKRRNNTSTPISQKLFSGNLLTYIEASKQPIPVVVESCVRFINLNGLHHEGIFRVPGLQVEIMSLRDAFERGEDPLAGGMSDIDSVACVLKLYFRGLEKPLFPEESFTPLMECVSVEKEMEKVGQIRAVVSTYPEPLVVVMRYLFAFLNHVSQYSDENMMQPYNLAVCFGPSLVRGPEDAGAAGLQLIIALVKSIILQHENIFPGQDELPGPAYETCMALEQDDCEPIADDGDGELESPAADKEGPSLEGPVLSGSATRPASAPKPPPRPKRPSLPR
uniref:Uncharacterized protein n=1 Tax=Denticeps clupeoides TaxID=299321 RepID=A0AAY4C7P0_9TELE